MAHACGHPHKSHYSNGMCQNCYLAKYYLKRKVKQDNKTKEKGDDKSPTCSENTHAESVFIGDLTNIQIPDSATENKVSDSVTETNAKDASNSVQM